MAKKKLIIEMRLNEYELRNRNVPWTAEELAQDAAACREAGASIVHFHARKADGSPAFDYESYRDVIAAIRASSDVLIHPTLGGPAHNASAQDRLSRFEEEITNTQSELIGGIETAVAQASRPKLTLVGSVAA